MPRSGGGALEGRGDLGWLRGRGLLAGGAATHNQNGGRDHRMLPGETVARFIGLTGKGRRRVNEVMHHASLEKKVWKLTIHFYFPPFLCIAMRLFYYFFISAEQIYF